MSAIIKILDADLINKIAAGEVIENPASVVKELVDNAIDAGASHIHIDILVGGRQLIRISDDGCGMSAEDALLSLKRHATSKMQDFADLFTLSTMGFRGEAIPSIASISKFSMTTSQGGDATKIRVEGGKLVENRIASRKRGTSIEVEQLFFNVPVRQNFQNSVSSDTAACTAMVQQLALANPSIAFTMTADRQSVFDVRAQTLEARIKALLGKEFFDSLSAVSYSQPGFSCEGFVGKSHFSKHNRKSQMLYINRRPVTCIEISEAVKEAYSTRLAAGRFPVFVLALTLDTQAVDINVHPQKKLIRLSGKTDFKTPLIQAVESSFRLPQASKPIVLPAFSFEMHEEPEMPRLNIPPKPIERALPRPTVAAQVPLFTPSLQIICQWQNFILVEPKELHMEASGLVFIDRALAERCVIFEKLMKQSQAIESQRLLTPLTITVTAELAARLEEHTDSLSTSGFCLRSFGPRSIIVEAIPSFMDREEVESSLIEILDGLRSTQTDKAKRLALAVSRSVRASKPVSDAQARALVTAWLACKAPSHCPQGKAVFSILDPNRIKQVQHANAHPEVTENTASQQVANAHSGAA